MKKSNDKSAVVTAPSKDPKLTKQPSATIQNVKAEVSKSKDPKETIKVDSKPTKD